jgi:3-oxoadipate enol-lactonase
MSGARPPVQLPPGRSIDLPGRGTTFIREVEGPPGAPTVVLLHGWTASADLNWFPSYEPLGRQFHVVALDHRGHGRGLRSNRRFRLRDCADDVAALAQVLGIERCIVAGYSMGGPIAMLTWQRHRDLVQGLVLCATASRFSSSDVRSQVLFNGMFGLAIAARVTPAQMRDHAMRRFVTRKVTGSPIGEWIASELHLHDPAALLHAGSAIGRFDAYLWLPEVDVPTAVLVTTEDVIVPPDRQLRLASAIPNSTVIEVAGGHGVCVERPSAFVPALLRACERVAKSSVGVAAPRVAPEPPGAHHRANRHPEHQA